MGRADDSNAAFTFIWFKGTEEVIMTRRLLRGLGLLAFLGLAVAAARQPAGVEYKPVASAAAVQSAVRSAVKILASWIDGQDYASAVGAANELGLLAQLQ